MKDGSGSVVSRKWTLSFVDPALERLYTAARATRRSKTHTAASYLLAAGVWVVMAASASATLSSSARTLWIVHVGLIAPFLLLGAVLQYREPFATRLWRPLSVTSALVPGLSVVLAQALLGAPYTGFGSATIALYVVAAHAFMGLRFIDATAVCVILLGAWEVVASPQPPLPHVAPFVALLVGMRVSHTEERYRRNDFLAQRELRAEQEKSERLLLNILPAPIAQRLKEDPAAIADRYPAATILFADIVGFTALSEGLDPVQLVERLNRVFSEFDEIADRLGLEKIKTIGDAYLVVGGLPVSREDHACAVADMALEMRDAIRRDPSGLKMRIGIHSGEVVAGVIGKRKYAYDLWGDAVNTASRMETHGRADAIHVSSATCAALRDAYELEERGEIDVKGKGSMKTFWLLGRRSRGAVVRPA